MFIEASICGLCICIVVDIGATLSVLGKEIFDKILNKTATLITIENVKHSVLSANSKPQKV